MIEHMNANKQFVEVIIAPSFEPAALELLQVKKNLRVLRTGGVDAPVRVEYRSVDGGILAQTADAVTETPDEFTVPTKRKPTDEEMDELLFAWKVCKGVKSNAILISKNHAVYCMGPVAGIASTQAAWPASARLRRANAWVLSRRTAAAFDAGSSRSATISMRWQALASPCHHPAPAAPSATRGASKWRRARYAAVFTGTPPVILVAPFCRERRQLLVGPWAGISPFSPRRCMRANALDLAQSAPPEPMLADVACGSGFCLLRHQRDFRPSLAALHASPFRAPI